MFYGWRMVAGAQLIIDCSPPLALGISQLGLPLAAARVPFFVSWILLEDGRCGTHLWIAGIGAVAAPLLSPLLWLAISDRPSDHELPTGNVGEPHLR